MCLVSRCWRRWSEGKKLHTVLESLQGPRLVSATAYRHRISRSLLPIWRRAFALSRSAPTEQPVFVPVVVVSKPDAISKRGSRLPALLAVDRILIV